MFIDESLFEDKINSGPQSLESPKVEFSSGRYARSSVASPRTPTLSASSHHFEEKEFQSVEGSSGSNVVTSRARMLAQQREIQFKKRNAAFQNEGMVRSSVENISLDSEKSKPSTPSMRQFSTPRAARDFSDNNANQVKKGVIEQCNDTERYYSDRRYDDQQEYRDHRKDNYERKQLDNNRDKYSLKNEDNDNAHYNNYRNGDRREVYGYYDDEVSRKQRYDEDRNDQRYNEDRHDQRYHDRYSSSPSEKRDRHYRDEEYNHSNRSSTNRDRDYPSMNESSRGNKMMNDSYPERYSDRDKQYNDRHYSHDRNDRNDRIDRYQNRSDRSTDSRRKYSDENDMDDRNTSLSSPMDSPLDTPISTAVPAPVIISDPNNTVIASVLASIPLNISNLREFLTTPLPKEAGIVQCYIRRIKTGSNKLFPIYTLYLKDGNRFLMMSKKRPNNRTSNYHISMDQSDNESGNGYLGKVRANFLGTEFQVFDDGVNPSNLTHAFSDTAHTRKELAAILYSANIMGSKGPRKMKVSFPALDDNNRPMILKPNVSPGGVAGSGDDLISRMKDRNRRELTYLINKPPRWNEQVGAYVLNFNGRVTMASVKNFQLVDPDIQDTVILQFGRVDKDEFTMDMQYPISPLQAFGITLSSFDSKIACD